MLDAGTFVASALIVLGIPASLGAPGADAARIAGGMRSAVAEGLRVVAGSRLLWTTLLALAVSMFGLGAVNVLFLPLIVDVLQVSPVWLGGVDAAQSASMILSAGIVAVLASRLRPTTIIAFAILAAGILVGLTGVVTEIWQVLLLLFAIGWFITPLQASVVTVMQTGVPDAARGRVMATLQSSMSGASIGSMALAGVFGDLIGIREVFVASGVIVVAGGLLAAVLYRGAGDARASSLESPRPDTVSGLEDGAT